MFCISFKLLSHYEVFKIRDSDSVREKKEEQVPLDQDMLEQFFKTFLRSRFQVQVCVTWTHPLAIQAPKINNDKN